jgi:hypothetical protein
MERDRRRDRQLIGVAGEDDGVGVPGGPVGAKAHGPFA